MLCESSVFDGCCVNPLCFWLMDAGGGVADGLCQNALHARLW